MNVKVDSVTQLFEEVNRVLGGGVLERPSVYEAHITVITPPEFDFVLKQSNVTINEINLAASRRNIQGFKFGVACIGRGRAINLEEGRKKVLDTYYIVVSDEDSSFYELRKEIHELYIRKGGDRSRFDPKAFWPHITLGFTERDLHIQDGVFKGINSCIKSLRVF
ncbi:hypothetical protein AYI68_g3383 [Smittium mucronatum]|uniref:Swiss Army Knife 2H phosphoesterase domain-containing protein n=1 Tax=Smittium mucronatum TaxID=133383 RepID=A0A1R0H055_9FUNG|nr:hypothetical protein AYI68_g3383 [Smittium mucronatum]